MLTSETIKYQESLANYCRTGKGNKIAGAIEKRLHHYRRLVFNVVKNTLSQAYPISEKVLGNEVWHNLADTFFRYHNCQAPQLWKLPFEFYEYISKNNFAQKLKLPWLNDLLFFEWIEIEMHTMPDEKQDDFTEKGNLFKDLLIVNKEYRLINLKYPVHILPVNEAGRKKGEYYVLVFREPGTGRVKFINLSVLNAIIFESLANKTFIEKIISDIKASFHMQDETRIKNHISGFINDLMAQKAILGYRNISN